MSGLKRGRGMGIRVYDELLHYLGGVQQKEKVTGAKPNTQLDTESDCLHGKAKQENNMVLITTVNAMNSSLLPIIR